MKCLAGSAWSLLVLLMLVSCTQEQPRIIVITATAPPVVSSNTTPVFVNPPPQQAQGVGDTELVVPASSTRPPLAVASEYTIQAGDTLSAIAANNGVPLQALIELNGLDDPNLIAVGQVLSLPEIPSEVAPSFSIMPDGRLVHGPDSRSFDVAAFIAQQQGYIGVATDDVTTRLANGSGLDQVLTSVQIVERVALEYSIDPRILLTLLEYRAGWLSNPTPREDLLEWPLLSEGASGDVDRAGLYRQLSWAADRLNRGYYGWKYRGLEFLVFAEGLRVRFADSTNAGTVALQYFFSLGETNYQRWLFDVDDNGFWRIYARYFDDPFANAPAAPVPANLTQPPLVLPFEAGDEWRYTGGPHGGWGSGSGWASLDFAPPDERPEGSSFCYTSQAWVTAIASGLVIRSADGATVIDLDNDGDESTGWTINYLHLTEQIDAGRVVQAGERIGRASCAGGFSTATHIHIGRRYNGEWIPADCPGCRSSVTIPTFIMGGWAAIGIAGQEYQGYLQSGEERLQAEQGRFSDINLISG